MAGWNKGISTPRLSGIKVINLSWIMFSLIGPHFSGDGGGCHFRVSDVHCLTPFLLGREE